LLRSSDLTAAPRGRCPAIVRCGAASRGEAASRKAGFAAISQPFLKLTPH